VGAAAVDVVVPNAGVEATPVPKLKPATIADTYDTPSQTQQARNEYRLVLHKNCTKTVHF